MTEHSNLIKMIKEGWPSLRTACPQSVLKEDLSVEGGIVYRGHRLIIPESEREGTLKILNEVHYGASKMLLKSQGFSILARHNKRLETTAERCHACAMNAGTVWQLTSSMSTSKTSS